MTLPEIFVQLPEDIQLALEKGLEGWGVNKGASPQEIFQETSDLIDQIKVENDTSQDDRDLLDQVPQAVVDLLF